MENSVRMRGSESFTVRKKRQEAKKSIENVNDKKTKNKEKEEEEESEKQLDLHYRSGQGRKCGDVGETVLKVRIDRRQHIDE